MPFGCARSQAPSRHFGIQSRPRIEYSWVFNADFLLAMSEPLFESDIPELERLHRGKVRDIYRVNDDHMLIVTTDRLSAFDVVLPTPIPGKGYVLTSLSNFWFQRTRSQIPNHLTELPLTAVIKRNEIVRAMTGRAVIVKKLDALPVEAVVRGYLVGSGWNEYLQHGKVCGIELPRHLQLADKLPAPIFTPSTKATVGTHDTNITFTDLENVVGTEVAAKIRDVSVRLYREAADYALKRGIIIADTKFEFGLDQAGELVLIDEALTPDSSRFWPAETYRPGISPPSFDKQFVRDYLETLDWDKTAPGPQLPQEIVVNTAQKYRQAQQLLLG